MEQVSGPVNEAGRSLALPDPGPYCVDMAAAGGYRVPGDIVISAWRYRTFSYVSCACFLVIGLLLLLGAVGGRSIGLGFSGLLFTLGGLSGLSKLNRYRPRIQVTADEIRYLQGRKVLTTVTRQQGSGLCLVPAQRTPGENVAARFTQPGSGVFIGLRGLSESTVRRACEARGWTFDGDTRPLAGDARRWWQEGHVCEAAHLVAVFGPFGADADESGTLSLDAAILEAHGDRLAAAHPGTGTSAYQQAAAMQRDYAGHATSSAQSSARLAQATRLEGKA
jgi:hypothetical protein